MFHRYLYIARSKSPPIVRYDPEDEELTNIYEGTGSAQSFTLDEYNNAIYWINYDGVDLRLTRTLLNGDTVDLNITYEGNLAITSDVLNLYILDKTSNDRIDKYLKATHEKVGNITYDGAINDLIIAYGKLYVLPVSNNVYTKELL